MTMTEQYNNNNGLQPAGYESPLVAVMPCELWSGICAQSVVTGVSFNEIAAEAQESGGEVDMSKDPFNHNWEDVVE